MEKSLEIDQLENDIKVANVKSKQSQEVGSFALSSGSYLWLKDELAGIHSLTLFFLLKLLKSNLEMLSEEHNHACDDVQMLKELNFLKKEREELLIRIRELDTRSELSNDFQVSSKCIFCRRKLYLK